MTSSLRIANYKRIHNEIELKNFGTINYLVGKNNSGKSSILTALANLNNTETDVKMKHFNKSSVVAFSLDEGEKHIGPTGIDPVPPYAALGGLYLGIVRSSRASHLQFPGVSSYEINYKQFQTESFNKLKNVSKELTGKEIIVSRPENEDVFNQSANNLLYKIDEIEVDPPDLSDGVKSITDLIYSVERTIEAYSQSERLGLILVLIEEPENNLHPEFQKLIPKLLSDLGSTVKGIPVRYFVSTHSPFIISASTSYQGQKVYLMQDGGLIDSEGNPVRSSNGYSGNECSKVVAQMLGADVVDLGYPTNYCLIEEASIQAIFEDAKRKGIIQDIQFISVAGASNIARSGKWMNELNSLSTLIRCNPFYGNRYRIILDKLNAKETVNLEPLMKKLGDRFTMLSEDKLEEYYKNIDEGISSQCTAQIEAADDREKRGTLKRQFAQQIAGLINNADDFHRLFNGELDFLLRV